MTQSVDDILDDGSKGLLYFEQLLPLYEEAFGTDAGWPKLKIQAAYDQERGMNLAKLVTSADALQKMITVADTQRGNQQSAANALGSTWQGAAADAGIGRLREIVGLAEGDRGKVQALATAMSAAATALQKIVEDKAATVKKLADGNRVEVGSQRTLITVGEMTVVDIQQIIRSSKSGDILSSLLQRLTEVPDIEDRAKDLERNSDPWKQAVKEICVDWLDTVFKKDYNDKLGVFNAQCSATLIAVQGQYNTVQTAADAIEERAYPSVAGVTPATPGDKAANGDPSKTNGNQPATNGNQAATNDGQTATAGTQNGDTSTGSPVKTKTQTTDDSTDDDDDDDDDSDTSSALSAIASSLSELGSTVSSALTGDLGDSLTSAIESAGTAISDGIEQMTEQASSLLSGEHEASFQLGDTKVSIEAGENGLSLTTTDADGTTTQYRLTLDENGIPVIEQDSSTTEEGNASPGTEGDGTSGSGAPESGGGSAAAPADAGAGAGGVATPTTPETPDPTNAPVTSEIGSGEPSSGSGTGGVPVGPRPPRQETDGEHTPTVEDHPASNPGDSGAVLAEAGPL
ncbi:hypothetical protein ACFU44_20815 [Nocardia rhizosphaerihabitans]|uniref:hypothetical protein n=1 Tax=Nocardia rhizosphaerihabitans TaxID=1691570 RepID=UPI00366AA6AD